MNLNKQANKKYIEGFLCAFAYLSFPSSEAFWDSTKNNTNGTKWDEGSAVGPTPFFCLSASSSIGIKHQGLLL